MTFKRNKFIILSFLIIVFIIGCSFFQYYKDNFSYAKGYYAIKENCYEKKNPNHEYCKRFPNEENLEKYIKTSDPKEEYKKLDTITLTCNIVEHTIFSMLQFFSPLLIIIALVGTIHSDFSSGMIKNYLMRMEYNDYLKKIRKQIFKISLITPLALILIFVISMVVTRFNFNVPLTEEFKNFAVYDHWKYSHFFLYGFAICISQYFLNILYCNIGLYACLKNKNKLVAIIMGYVLFLLVDLFIYIVVYAFVINKILGFKNLTDIFNITGYWFFDGNICLIAILVSFVIQLLSFLFIHLYYRNKEGVIISNEKQTA